MFKFYNKQILHLSIDDLIQLKSIDFKSQQLLDKYEFSKQDDFKFTIKFLGNIFRRYSKNDLNDTELVSHFPHLSQSHHKIILNVAETRKSDILDWILKEYNALEGNLLESFDWDVKWILGNNSLMSMREQIASLELISRNSVSNQRTSVTIEMDEKGVDKVLGALESCLEQLENNL